MSIRVYNTKTGNKEPFETINPGAVGMYVCGVTVYDLCHIGHARSAVVFDVIYRYLKYAGLDVTYVRNFTDVDDKIINRANERGLTSAEVAEKNIEEFYVDMDALGVLRPTIEPRATGHIPEMIAHVEKLIETGHAYAVEGDVYFSVPSHKKYGHLSGRNTDDMMSGARVEVDERKKSPLDFALWKSAKPGEPSWESPWGQGRPGWHIECTVMGQKYLGDTLDIHGGGKDLVFPHHENEAAQAEALTDKPFVNYWMHNGFVNIDQEKMSKSLGNFFTIRDVLKVIHPEVLRSFLLSHHYRSPVDYTETALKDARVTMDRLYGLIGRLEEILEGKEVSAAVEPEALSDKSRAVHGAVLEMFQKFDNAMDDDFNTAEALGHIHKCARQVGALIHEGGGEVESNLPLFAYALESFRSLGSVLGLMEHSAAEYFSSQHADAVASKGIDEGEIDKLVQERLDARAAKDWGRADEIRDLLTEKGIVLEDGPEGTTWKVKA
jgi:cysteinyl-tRNA synthetase